MEHYYKFDLIGIIQWADMSVTDIRIREYDDDGNERMNLGYMSTSGTFFGERYGSICNNSQPGRCIAEPYIRLGDNDEYLECTGYSLIDFSTGELYTLSNPYRGYSIWDYMIRYDYKNRETEESI